MAVDTSSYVEDLKQAGVDPEQAIVMVNALSTMIADQLRDDLHSLDLDLREKTKTFASVTELDSVRKNLDGMYNDSVANSTPYVKKCTASGKK